MAIFFHFIGEKFREVFKSSIKRKNKTNGRQVPAMATKSEIQKSDVLLEPRGVRVLNNQHQMEEV